MNVAVDNCASSVTTQSSVDGETESMSYSDSEIGSIVDPDENFCGEDLEINSLWYSDSETESISDPDDILRGEDLEVNSLCYSDSEIGSIFDPDENLCGKDLETNSLWYSDSEIVSISDPDDILSGEDLEVNSLCYSDSEIDSVFDLDDILSAKDLEVDLLRPADSEIDSVLGPDKVDFGETPHPSSPSTSPVISVKVEVVDTIAAAVTESDASSENEGKVKHVPQEKVSEVRNATEEVEAEVSVAKRHRRSQRQPVRMSSVGVACRTRSCRERATRSNVRAGKAMLYPFCLS